MNGRTAGGFVAAGAAPERLREAFAGAMKTLGVAGNRTTRERGPCFRVGPYKRQLTMTRTGKHNAAGIKRGGSASAPDHDLIARVNEAQDFARDFLDDVGIGFVRRQHSNNADRSVSADLTSRPCRPYIA